MKRLSNLLAALVFASLVIFMSCGGGGSDPAPSEGETAAGELSGTWTVDGNPIFGSNAEGDWSGFTLTINGTSEGSNGVWGGSWSVSNIADGYGEVWGASSSATTASGTWDFEGATSTDLIIRDDGVEIAIKVTETTLNASFIVESPGRTSGIFDDTWTFNFTN